MPNFYLDRDDLAQHARLALWLSPKPLKSRALIYTAAAARMIDYVRAASDHSRLGIGNKIGHHLPLDFAENLPSRGLTVHDRALYAELMAIIESHKGHLTDKERVTVKRFISGNLTYTEIAEDEGVTRKAVSFRIESAMAKIRRVVHVTA